MSGLASNVETLLLMHGVTAPETPFAGGEGYSGAAFAAVDGPDGPLVVKRLRYDADWLMRLTRDASYREAQFAASPLPACLPDGVVERYRGHLERALEGTGASVMWQEQVALIGVLGLLLYGWGKALDAEAGSPDELRWWCERAAAGARVRGW